VLVVDSSVWIDFFRGAPAHQAEQLAQLLDHGEVRIVVPDIVLFEVLRGFRFERDMRTARALLESLSIEAAVDPDLADEAVDHYRSLRSRGCPVASSIDVLVATFCIDRDYALLHADRDYDYFEHHRGLRVWRQ
jgi:predicted nucleic acid-binding protein